MLLASATAASAQELEPRAYSASPVGANFIVAGLLRSTGSVIFDPSLPIKNVSAELYASAVGYGRTFDLFGAQALITASLPYVRGSVSGEVFDESRTVSRSGLGDARAKLAVNLIGSPARTREEFVRSTPGFILGTSLTVVAPTGQYFADKLINIGANRWAVKPELGVSYPWRRLYFDLYAGVWFYTENRSFYPGEVKRQQDPLTALQAHVSYTFHPRLWLAVDSTWYFGGATSSNGGPAMSRLDTKRLGTVLSLPIGKSQSLKVSYSNGVSARIGQNFETIGVAWQYLWF